MAFQFFAPDDASLRLFSPQHSDPSPVGHPFFGWTRRLVGCALLCQSLAACSVVAPFSPGVDSAPTGSIAKPIEKPPATPALPGSLDEEDRRRALGALAIALDPQGNGTAVRWDNPASKAHGQVTPVGFAYPAKDLICRDFSAQFDTRSGAQSGRGAACRDKSAQWTIAELHIAKAE
jgi:surface antigen